MAPEDDEPPPLQEALHLIRLPPAGEARRFMGTRAAYLLGSDFPKGNRVPWTHTAAFGGHVYAQAALAASRTWRELEREKGAGAPSERLHLHTIHGYFTRPGISNRPFIYAVTPLTSSRTFSTLSITAWQPSQPSTNPQGDHFPPADALLPLSPPSFTAICSLKLPSPHSAGVTAQEPPPQTRFAAVLSSRPPDAWPPAPPVDIPSVVALLGAHQRGRFPVAVMHKVDMAAHNAAPRPVHEHRELLLYRLVRPLPVDDDDDDDGREEPGKERWDANAHVAAHAFVADRTGLLMAANHAGFGRSLARAATLSYSFVVHVNADEAVMREADGWWVQEVCFPRVGVGRGVVESKIWSPRGVHVATEYQDGLIEGLSIDSMGGSKL